MAGELVEFEESTIGIVPNLESNNVGVVLMGDGLMIQEGMSEAYLGRVINALAKPIDGRGEISSFESRHSVYEPLQICLIAIDSMIIIGCGQNVICVYGAIGQKASSMVAALAEYFMYCKRHILIIRDDPSKQAQAYSQISLLLRRPPAAKSSSRLGEGSMIALPIVKTQSGDVSAYILTNVISITDGQIFLSNDLFNFGVGSTAQIKAMKQVAGKSKLELAQFAAPLAVEEQIVTIYTGKFLVHLRTYLRTNKPRFQEIISSTWTFTEEA
ncbi:hypothetical protein AMTRI_Chr02g260710 [Amborella trichopoda]